MATKEELIKEGWLPPSSFQVGDILYVPGWCSDGTNHLWLVIGGPRNVMDMNSGYTMPAIDANRWMWCKKVEHIRIKTLHFLPEVECYISVSVKGKPIPSNSGSPTL